MALASKRIVLIIASLGSFLTPFMASSINIALPDIGEEFSMGAILLSWVATSYLLSSAVFLVPFGKIGDKFGRKKIYTYGIITFVLASFGCSVSFSAGMLIFFRVIQGLGSAMLFSTGTAILTSAYPEKERGKAIGINTASIYAGLTAGPSIGGVLTNLFGWRSIFAANLPLGSIVFLLILFKLKNEWYGEKTSGFDYFGSLLYGLMLLMFTYGLSILPQYTGILFLFFGLLLSVFFIKWELKVKEPVLNMNLFKENRKFTFSNVAAFINYGTTFAVSFLLSLYLQYIKGFNPGQTGLILLSQPVVMILFSILAGRLSDKIESRKISSFGLFITSLSLFTLSFINVETSIVFIVISLMVLGVGLAFFAAPNIHAIMSSVEEKFYGLTSAIIGTTKVTGQMFSMAVASLIIGIYVGRSEINPQNYFLLLKSERVTFLIFSILCIAGVFISLARDNTLYQKTK
ncbi:MFS transporter [Herbivorax sp. ANBcel31]|uniref:MFS transporter n=1 Tax=Herbivorax sp. ANBcel31 TaxID=3069754 RepID=UPI0027B32BB0|nr:MFS transporter [Herbivorax sp. ANBcel31]MDQ2085131.1 MFS transporter [Herbivorax sp. ANBcel31]